MQLQPGTMRVRQSARASPVLESAPVHCVEWQAEPLCVAATLESHLQKPCEERSQVGGATIGLQSRWWCWVCSHAMLSLQQRPQLQRRERAAAWGRGEWRARGERG